MKHKFTYKETDNNVDIYEMDIQLEDDKTPSSDHFIRLRVEIEDDKELLSVYHVGPAGVRPVGRDDIAVTDKTALANILYGAATLRTVKKFTPK